MPFNPGERVDWIPAKADPATAVFRMEGLPAPLTVANGGLIERRKGALHPLFVAPRAPGKYHYEFESGGEIIAAGHVRVRTTRPQRPAKRSTAPKPPEFRGVRARRSGEG